MKDFSGVFTALLTPFNKGEIDWSSLRRLVHAQLEGGINGLVICGTTGESPSLSEDEKTKLFQFVKAEVSGQVPLIMGTGTNCTAKTVKATQEAQQLGADAALVVVPYYNRPPQRGLFQHFQKVSECSELPILLYNVPSRTVAKLELDTIQELSQLPNIIGIKEATGNVEFGRQIVEACGRDFLLTSGDDGTFLDLVANGANGVISVASNLFPKMFVNWCSRARRGDMGAREEFQQFAELNSYLYVEANPIPAKMAAHVLGLIDSAEMRLPLVELSEKHTAELRAKMKAGGYL